LISNAIFNCHAYTQWVDRIISYKFLSFSMMLHLSACFSHPKH
jgi:hypothetical protein